MTIRRRLRHIGKRVIPDWLHSFRVRHWGKISTDEQALGHARKIILRLDAHLAKYTKEIGKLPPERQRRRTQLTARGVLFALTQLTDEMLTACATAKPTSKPNWNTQFMENWRAYARKVPKDVRQEIHRQLRKED